MGLAAFGDAALRDEFARARRASSDDGAFELDLAYFALPHRHRARLRARARGAARPARGRTGAPWDLDGSADDRRYADIAATLQAVTEEALLGAGARGARAHRRATRSAWPAASRSTRSPTRGSRARPGSRACSCSRRPATRAARSARRCSARSSSASRGPRRWRRPRSALPIDAGARRRARRRARARPRARADGSRGRDRRRWSRAGKIVALVRRAASSGGRARSASARSSPTRASPAMRERLNRAIKRREPFRPFAPAVLADARRRASSTGAPSDMTPFMTTVCPVRAERAARARGGDATSTAPRACRPSTAAARPSCLRCSTRSARAPALPIVLNTSLNGPRRADRRRTRSTRSRSSWPTRRRDGDRRRAGRAAAGGRRVKTPRLFRRLGARLRTVGRLLGPLRASRPLVPGAAAGRAAAGGAAAGATGGLSYVAPFLYSLF